MPLVSVGVPVYNGERYLEEALSSILAQEAVEFELIVSDNASTDRTQDVCMSFAASDRRVRYLRNASNVGAAANYNRLVDVARGEYFKWSAHDDVLAPTFLRDCLAELDRDRQAVLCYPHAVAIDETGDEIEPETMDDLVVRSASAHERLREYLASSWSNPRCTAVLGVMRTAALRRTRMIGPYISADRILLAELALHGTFVRVPGMLLRRRRHEESSLKAHASLESRMRWFDPSFKGSVVAPHFLWLRKYVTAIHSAGLPMSESVRCYWALRDHIVRAKPWLLHELKCALTGAR
jgi:glycosyltransferase involved in cell wall biosynthesis